MKCICNECNIEFEYEFKISICKDCLLKYNGRDFDIFCNKCKKRVTTIKKSITENNWIDVYRNCIKEKHFCDECDLT